VATVETSPGTELVVALTASAAEKIKVLMGQEPSGEAEVLRLAIRGGGCSGFEYALGFDRGPGEGDLESESHGARVVVDPFSAPYLQGSTIDFLEGLQESGFKIENPNVTAACGCGHSFQVEDGEAPDPDATACGSGCGHSGV
jgi:iron-sulfur cluster assembly protein